MHSLKDIQMEMRLILAGTAEWLCYIMDVSAVARGFGIEGAQFSDDESMGPGREGVVNPELMDLDKAAIWWDMRRVHDYALGNVPYENGHINDQISDVALFFGFLRANDLPAGSAMEFIHPREDFRFKRACVDTLEAALARFKLDSREDDLSFRDLALLGDVNEQTVRNAASKKSGDGLLAFQGPAGQSVRPKDAINWLAGRRGFRPTPDGWYRSEKASLEACMNGEAFGAYISARRQSLSMTIEQLARRATIRANELRALESGDISLDLSKLSRLAVTLRENPRKFSAAALESFFGGPESIVGKEEGHV